MKKMPDQNMQDPHKRTDEDMEDTDIDQGPASKGGQANVDTDMEDTDLREEDDQTS